MDTAMMIGLSRQMTLRRSLEITANNIANMSTTGFKAEHLMLEETRPKTSNGGSADHQTSYVTDWGVGRDYRDGSMVRSGRPLDVALEGEGFFAVQGPEDILYTRDGRFTTDPTGRLTTSDGLAVLDENGAEIIIGPEDGPPAINSQGGVYANGAEIGRLGIYRFEDLSALEKLGEARFSADDPNAAQRVEIPIVHQGFTENSNVNSVRELTNMMQITRAYTSTSKMIEDASDLHKRAIDRIGRVNA